MRVHTLASPEERNSPKRNRENKTREYSFRTHVSKVSACCGSVKLTALPSCDHLDKIRAVSTRVEKHCTGTNIIAFDPYTSPTTGTRDY